MWVFTLDGFYSAVEHKDDPSLLVVRTRTIQDATNLQDQLAHIRCHVDVLTTPAADYGWRLIVPRQKWAVYLHNATEAIDYTNFKDAVHREVGTKRAEVYTDVWVTMWNLQHGV